MVATKSREIELKNLAVGDEGVTEAINYLEVLKLCLTAPKNPQTGATTAEIREVLPILNLLDDAKDGDKIQLSEGQWANVKNRIKGLTFTQIKRAVVHFEDDIINAKEVAMVPAGGDKESENE